MENTPTVGALPKRRNRPPQTLTKRAMGIEFRDAGLNMTIPPEMRDLAQRLLTYEANAGKTVTLKTSSREMILSQQDFLLSFAQPNFYFHLTTAYDILRHKGVAIGKMDFLGGV